MAYLQKNSRLWAVVVALITMALMFAASPTKAASKFTDVNARYTEAVNYLLENGITQGLTETEYGTYAPIKRVDASIMLARALKLETTEGAVSGFTDVPARGEPAVKALRDAKIVSGKTADYFAAQDNITRGEMALILTRGYKLSGEGTQIPFTDVADRYKDAVAALYKYEITFGKTATTFGTHEDVTRGEFALFLHRLSQLTAEQPGGIELSLLDNGLLDGSISIDKLLSDSKLLRVSLPVAGLVPGDTLDLGLGLGDINLLTVTLTQDDIDRGYVDLGLSTDILKTLTGLVPLDLTAILSSGGDILDTVTQTIELPSLLVKPVVDLTKNTLNDLGYILSGERELLVDITGKGIQPAKAGDQVNLTIVAGGNTEKVSKAITAEEAQAGVVKMKFTDSDLVGRLLEGLTVGSEIVITPEVTDGVQTTKGDAASYTVSEGLVESVVGLVVDLLGGALAGDVLDLLKGDILAGVLDGGALGAVLDGVLGGLLGELVGGEALTGLLGGESLLSGLLGGLLGDDGGLLSGLLGEGGLLSGLLGDGGLLSLLDLEGLLGGLLGDLLGGLSL